MLAEKEIISSIKRVNNSVFGGNIKTKSDMQEYAALAKIPKDWAVGQTVQQSNLGQSMKLVNLSLSPNIELPVQPAIEAE